MTIKIICMTLLCLSFTWYSHANEAISKVHFKGGESKTYEQLLTDNELAGISVAVVDDYEVIFSFAGGKKDFTTKSDVDNNTSFNAASISKPVVATLAVMLAEQGELDLDAPVISYLKSWKMSESDLDKGKAITLRHLLTHTAGTSHSGYGSKYLGDIIPTTAETLDTYKNEKITISFEPGSNWKYSGGGFLISQIALEDITGKSIAKLAEAMLFTPLGMESTVFYQHGQSKFPSNVAKAHNDKREVISTGIPICPEAACGLWTNAMDMAKLSIEIQKALSGVSTKVISRVVAQELIKIQTTKLSGGWSIGWMRNLAVGNLDWFSHSGYNNGTGGLIMATVENGRGIFIFGNGAYRARLSTIDQIVSSVIDSMGWKKDIEATVETPSKGLVKSIVGNYENLTPHHFSPFAKRVRIEEQDGILVLLNSQNEIKPLPLIHIGKDKFRVDQLVNSQIGFLVDKSGAVYLTLEQTDTELVSKALRKLNRS
ncbi:serine hydrolase domain-containing protein [Microbulbifer sp. TYP-18]|uniref:serine hydrolase domain-containing protein n=1 Tax=Microbulbifer sp. TYP-18 TaxID=3230024 RepID=UPI0034C6B5AD